MRASQRAFIAIFLCLLTFSGWAKSFRVAVFADQIRYLEPMLDGDRCLGLDEAEFGENQMLLEYLFVCHLLTNAFEEAEIELVGFPVVRRVVDELAAGNVDISGFGVWSQEGENPQVYQSAALLQKGEFTKGLFVKASTQARFTSELKGDLSALVAVSNENWTYDWAALECAGMRVLHVNHYEQMFNVVGAERADLLALAFGSDSSLEREVFGISLSPLENYRMVIPDSNHILVSKKFPDAERLMKVLNMGIDSMRMSNTLRDRYREVGVLNPHVSEWQSICAR